MKNLSRIFRVVVPVCFLLVAIFSCITAGATDKTTFPVAVWYSGGKARAPMLERVDATSAARWGKDLDAIKGAGFNAVKTWVDWATAQPKPDQFRFDNLDLLLRLAQQRGLRVIVQVYLDSAPDWVGEKYPDGNFVDRSGAVIKSQAAPGYCMDHPGVRAEAEKFLHALAARAAQSSALYGWDVWSEPAVINWAEFPFLANPEFCFCPHSEARFREFLQRKYGSLENLNQAWYRGFERWQQVEPPRASTILSYTDYLDWRGYIPVKLANDLKMRVDAIRSGDPSHPITSHAAVPGIFTSPTNGFGSPDDYLMAANADFFGTSIYPRHAATSSSKGWPYTQLAAGLDFERSVGHSLGKSFWIGELQAGQGVTAMRIADPVGARDLEHWLWQMVAHGTHSISIYAWYPMSSGYESNGYGLVELDGTLTDRTRAAGKVAQIIAGNAAELRASQPAPAQVAALWNPLSYMVGGAQPSLSKLGAAGRDSLMGLHRAFFEEQIPLDFVQARDVTQNRLGQYKVLFVPYAVMLAKDVGDGIRRYVEGGGTVVAEARLAWNDERGFASDIIPGFGLHEVFGAREKLIRPADKAIMTLADDVTLPGTSNGEKITAEGFEEVLEPAAGARVLARFNDGAPAIVEHRMGKGRAILVGSFAALSYQRTHDPSIKHLLVGLAHAAGVTPEVQVTGSGTAELQISRLVGENSEFLFAFNHADAPAQANVKIALRWSSVKATDLTTGLPMPLTMTGQQAALQKRFAPGEILVLKLSPK